MQNKWIVRTTMVGCFAVATASLFGSFYKTPEQIELDNVQNLHRIRSSLKAQLGPQMQRHEWPPELQIDWFGEKKNLTVKYTLDSELQSEADRLLRIHKPDYGAIVVMDAMTGKILALSSFIKNTNEENQNSLVFRGSFPAASIFKIVTAASAVDKYGLDADTLVMFNGGNHTLYRKNVMSNKVNRWTREMTLREAFARSINTFFGRLTFEKMQPKDLQEYAFRFGFNKHIESELPFETGFTDVPQEESFELAEIASGFNRVTTMSPVQGAMIAAAIANDGVMKVPYIIDSLKDEKGEVLYQAQPVTAAVTTTPEGAHRLKELMEATITHGTSRRYFKPLVRDRRFKELELGGKTGSLTGTNPRGKTDWFVGYAIGDNTRLAVAAVTVNIKYWTVKSSHLAQSMLQKHFKEEYLEAKRRLEAERTSANNL